MVDDYPDEKQRYAVCNTLWKNKKEMNMDNLETRVFDASELRMTKSDDGIMRFEGYAAMFNKWSEDLGGFREKIAPKAFTKALKNSDTRALFNHDSNYVLGRTSAKTLDIREDEKGLKFSVVPPDTTWARDLSVSLGRGDISQCSFGFTLGIDEWKEDKDGVSRTIKEVDRLPDISIVTYPAYPDTSVALRNMEQAKTEQPPDKREIMSEMIEAFLSDNELSEEQREQYSAIVDDMAQRFSKPMQIELKELTGEQYKQYIAILNELSKRVNEPMQVDSEEQEAEVGEQRDGEPDSDNEPKQEIADIPLEDCRKFFGKA